MNTNQKFHVGHVIRVGLLAMLAIIGFDLFLHAGILANLYNTPSPFLLSPEESFRRIPIGYLSFALLLVLFIWIACRLNITGWKKGLWYGLGFGAITWGSFVLGLYSISSASPGLLTGWFLGQTIEMGFAGMVVGAGLSSDRLRPLFFKVLIFFVLMVVLSIVLQNLGNF